MSNITKDQVIEWLSAQTVLDLAALVKDLEGKWAFPPLLPPFPLLRVALLLPLPRLRPRPNSPSS